MPARMILALMLGMLVLPACQQDEPALATEGASQAVADEPDLSLQERADQGDAEAQYRLGYRYWIGRNVPQDYEEAAKWYQASAEQGNAMAQRLLAGMYYEGEGVPLDKKEAVQWYKAAAEQGNEEAQHRLGAMYYMGEGVPQDYKEALRWFQAAADQGVAQAQFGLGMMYEVGQGVPQDYVRAHMWYNLSASNFTGDEAKLPTQVRDGIAEQMTSEQIAEAQRLAREWKPKAGGQ